MATNLVQYDGDTLGNVTPTHPAAPVSGDAVRLGGLTGVAITDAGDGGNDAGALTIDLGQRVWNILVDDNLGVGMAVGDELYYHDTQTGTSPTSVNNDPTAADAVWGVALEVLGANANTTIKTLHITTLEQL